MDVVRKREAPEVSVVLVVKVHTSHAGFGRVGSAQDGGLLGHYLSKVRRSVTEAGRQGGEGSNVLTQGARDSYAVTVCLVEGQLEGAEESSRAGDGDGDEAELAKVGLPLALAHPLCCGEVGEDLS